ncbi:glycosyltransferase family 4 protein [Methylorubrum populi]|uniref:glycosyltransferase family 4 protein n=1 Tax=Methylorubrum populi TaxID=223967 RepID=UPI00114EB9F6|nr:glycosyltransferase family 4 protein [Methylorubrum populi]QDI82175.1 glycosyltransferase family 4 protein [Methylorubrum populi]
MKKWQIPSSIIKRYIPYSAVKKRLLKQVALLEDSILFDKEYYMEQAKRAGIEIEINRAVWHYVTIGDRLRLKTHRLFDTHYYHDVYRDVEPAGMTALHHFVEHGARENRNPHPAFDCSHVRLQTLSDENPLLSYILSEKGSLNPHRLFDERFVISQIAPDQLNGKTVLEAYFDSSLDVEPSEHFNPAEYYERYPSIKDLHPFYHYVRWGIGEGRLITGRSGSIKNIMAEIEHAALADPDIIPPWQDIDEIGRVQRLATKSLEEELMLRLTDGLDQSKTTFIAVTSYLSAGGAEKVLANICNAMEESEEIEQIIIIKTGRGENNDGRWLGKSNQIVIDLSDIIDSIPGKSAALTFAIFLRMLNLTCVFVVNSPLGWDLIERHGRVLNKICNLSVACFCYDYDDFGRCAGYARTHLPHALPYVDKIVTDNAAFRDVLVQDLSLDKEEARKIVVLYQPIQLHLIDRQLDRVSSRALRNVLWAGRFSKQKRVDLAIEIAKEMPDLHFTLAGGVEGDLGLSAIALPTNITFYGAYERFESLPIQRFDIFLYTAQWDGLPNVLLEAAAVGLPIVAPDIGGIPELISEHTGWLVSENSSAYAFSQTIRTLIGNPQLARDKAMSLAKLLKVRHSRELFAIEAVQKLVKDR